MKRTKIRENRKDDDSYSHEDSVEVHDKEIEIGGRKSNSCIMKHNMRRKKILLAGYVIRDIDIAVSSPIVVKMTNSASVSETSQYLLQIGDQGTTVESSPEDAARLVRSLKERQGGGTTNWFHVSPREMGAVLGRDTLWDEPPIHRGRSYEQLRSANIAGNYPIIDDINDHAATSMKTLDLTTGPYQDPSVLGSIVRGYIEHLANFSGPQQKYLEIGIPSGKASLNQLEQLHELQDYAGTIGVILVIGEIP